MCPVCGAEVHFTLQGRNTTVETARVYCLSCLSEVVIPAENGIDSVKEALKVLAEIAEELSRKEISFYGNVIRFEEILRIEATLTENTVRVVTEYGNREISLEFNLEDDTVTVEEFGSVRVERAYPIRFRVGKLRNLPFSAIRTGKSLEEFLKKLFYGGSMEFVKKEVRL